MFVIKRQGWRSDSRQRAQGEGTVRFTMPDVSSVLSHHHLLQQDVREELREDL